jgi:hypothetical protein
MRQSEPPMPKIDKPGVTIPGTDGAIAAVTDILPALQQATIDPKHVV